MKGKQNTPVPLDSRSAEDIRRELREGFDWDLAAMARNYRRSLEEMAALVRLGGENARKREDRRHRLSSYDVAFVPTVNVKAEVADPFHPTEEEMDAIIGKASRAVAEQFGDKVNAENLLSVSLYEKDTREGPLFAPASVFDASTSPKRFLLTCVNEKHEIVNTSIHESHEAAADEMQLQYERELADPGSPGEDETESGHDGCSFDAKGGSAVIDINDEWGYWWEIIELRP